MHATNTGPTRSAKKQNLESLIISEEEDFKYLTGLTFRNLERLFPLVVKPSEVTFIVSMMELSNLKHVDKVTSNKHYWEYPEHT